MINKVKIFKEYLARVTESANKPNELHKQQLIRSTNELIQMYVEAKQETEDQTKWADYYFVESKQKKNIIRELEGSLGWHIEAVKRYEEALKFYADDENYEAWSEYEDATGYFNNVDFDSGDKAKNALEVIADGEKPDPNCQLCDGLGILTMDEGTNFVHFADLECDCVKED
jgi:hypothetical protein